MSDEAAKRCVLTTLAKPEIRRINFHMGSVQITARLFERVRTCITQNRIHVRHRSSLRSDQYNHGNNTLYLRFDRITRTTQEASIVHECVHAGLDLARASRMRLISSEAAAYIAQCIYARQRNRDPNQRLMSSTPARDRVFEIAWRLAGEVLAGRQPSNADLNALRQAVSGHPFYSGGRHLAGYDGVP